MTFKEAKRKLGTFAKPRGKSIGVEMYSLNGSSICVSDGFIAISAKGPTMGDAIDRITEAFGEPDESYDSPWGTGVWYMIYRKTHKEERAEGGSSTR